MEDGPRALDGVELDGQLAALGVHDRHRRVVRAHDLAFQAAGGLIVAVLAQRDDLADGAREVFGGAKAPFQAGT